MRPGRLARRAGRRSLTRHLAGPSARQKTKDLGLTTNRPTTGYWEAGRRRPLTISGRGVGRRAAALGAGQFARRHDLTDPMMIDDGAARNQVRPRPHPRTWDQRATVSGLPESRTITRPARSRPAGAKAAREGQARVQPPRGTAVPLTRSGAARAHGRTIRAVDGRPTTVRGALRPAVRAGQPTVRGALRPAVRAGQPTVRGGRAPMARAHAVRVAVIPALAARASVAQAPVARMVTVARPPVAPGVRVPRAIAEQILAARGRSAGSPAT